QARNAASADIRSDLYCVGGTLFFLLTGHTPFSGTSVELVQAHLSKPAPRVETIRPGVPTAIGDIIAKLLEKDPANRFATPAALAEALAKVGGQLSGEKPSLPSPPPPPVAQPMTQAPFSFADDTAIEDIDEEGTLPTASMTTAPARRVHGNGASK